MAADNKTRFDRNIEWIKNHRIISAFLVAGAIVTALASMSNSVKTLLTNTSEIGELLQGDGPIYAGIVRKPDGEPLKDAVVKLLGTTLPDLRTGDDGRFSFTLSEEPASKIMVAVIPPDFQFQNFTKSLDLTAVTDRDELRLEPSKYPSLDNQSFRLRLLAPGTELWLAAPRTGNAFSRAGWSIVRLGDQPMAETSGIWTVEQASARQENDRRGIAAFFRNDAFGQRHAFCNGDGFDFSVTVQPDPPAGIANGQWMIWYDTEYAANGEIQIECNPPDAGRSTLHGDVQAMSVSVAPDSGQATSQWQVEISR